MEQALYVKKNYKCNSIADVYFQRYLRPYLYNNPIWLYPFVCCSSGTVLNNVTYPSESVICTIFVQDNDNAY